MCDLGHPHKHQEVQHVLLGVIAEPLRQKKEESTRVHMTQELFDLERLARILVQRLVKVNRGVDRFGKRQRVWTLRDAVEDIRRVSYKNEDFNRWDKSQHILCRYGSV